MTRILLIALGIASFILVTLGNLMPGAREVPLASLERITFEAPRTYVKQDGLRYVVTGATKHLVAETGKEMQEGFHEFRWLRGGHLVGRSGAFYFLVDPYEGKLESKGFHHISVTDNGFVASYGSTRFVLDPSGQVISRDGEAEPATY